MAHFIRYFPIYVNRVESQLGGADGLEIRSNVDAAYDRIVQAMFDCLHDSKSVRCGSHAVHLDTAIVINFLRGSVNKIANRIVFCFPNYLRQIE